MPRVRGRIDHEGAIVRVSVAVGGAKENSLISRGLAALGPFATTGLIDTGASESVIHPLVARQLGLVAVGLTPLATPGHDLADVALHDVRLALGHAPALGPWIAVQAAEVAAATRGVLVILGRDFLTRYTLRYNGRDQSFSLWT